MSSAEDKIFHLFFHCKSFIYSS